MEKQCVICGQMFTTNSSRRKMCYNDHFHPCPVCGVDVLTTDLQHLESCCCPAHSRQLATQSIHERFEEWPSNSAEAAAKRKATSLARYGVDNPSKNDEIKKRVSKGLRERYKIDGQDIRARAQETYFKRTGYRFPAQNPEVQERVRKETLEKYGVPCTLQAPEVAAKVDATNLERWGTIIPMQNPEVHARQRKRRSSYSASDGTALDSMYEVNVYEYCLRNNIPIKRSYPIKFEYEGEEHTTFIDFEIDGMLVEVKGEHILEGYFDFQPGTVPMWRKLEVYAEHGVILITGATKADLFKDSQGVKYASKPQLIGIDIELFDNPKFPYAKNRPECFYEVRTNNSRSPVEAFQDEQLRWKMIKNRIRYVGGFISSKQILTAFNVSKTCKQPSWFSLQYAKDLLAKYATSDLILDPFAGWGTRCDAAKLLYKEYRGCDLNPKVVEWHQSLKRPIILGDARNFKYDGECNVFTCPPYRDTEIYFEGQDILTSECEWLDIIRENIPNATRYIMVCKDVSPKYEQYVVERKKNKSHLGTNYESVIVVDNR